MPYLVKLSNMTSSSFRINMALNSGCGSPPFQPALVSQRFAELDHSRGCNWRKIVLFCCRRVELNSFAHFNLASSNLCLRIHKMTFVY